MTLCEQAAAKLGLKIELKTPGGQKRKRASAKIKDTLPFYMSVQLNVDPAKLGQPVSRPRTYTWFFLTSVFDLDKHVSFADLFECPLVATGDAFLAFTAEQRRAKINEMLKGGVDGGAAVAVSDEDRNKIMASDAMPPAMRIRLQRYRRAAQDFGV